jgi:hypothetical protein
VNRANDLVHVCTDAQSTPNGTLQLGLTIREHFAAMAMQGLLANPTIPQIARSQGAETHEAIMDWYSQGAVQHADALIAELAK